jgi:hypothetical protein
MAMSSSVTRNAPDAGQKARRLSAVALAPAVPGEVIDSRPIGAGQ